MAALCIPYASVQIVYQEGIDRVRDWLLQTTDKMPMPEAELKNIPPEILSAVNDIISADNALDNTDDLYGLSPDRLASILIHQTNGAKHYSKDEEYQIESALTRYLISLKVWAVKQPEFLRNNLEFLGFKIRNQEIIITAIDKKLDNHHDKIEKQKVQLDKQQDQLASQQRLLLDQQKQIDELNNATLPVLPRIELASVECFSKESQNFYSYFKNDTSLNVEEFFLCENYEKWTLDSENETLHKCFQNTSSQKMDLECIIRIIQNQKILLITGTYGTGKSALLKRLHYEIRKDSENCVYFFHARDLVNVIDEVGITIHQGCRCEINQLLMTDKFLRLSDNHRSNYIFIDELDELNIGIQNAEGLHIASYLSVFFSWLCEFQRDNRSFFFILGSRKYSQLSDNTEVCVADSLYENYYLIYETKLDIVYSNYFSSDARSKWIDEFAIHKNTYASYTEIKENYGKIANALKTPIFLYAFMQRYLSNTSIQDSLGYYFYYAQFIDKTVSGKYGYQHTKNVSVGVLPDQYRVFLQEIAFRILKYSERYLTGEIYSNALSEEQPLLADELTNRKFEMPLSELNELLCSSKYESANFVNCYFFNMDRRRVYFTDTNILFALASEYIFNKFENIVLTSSYDFSIDHLQEIELLRLYPHLVDYIIFLARKSEFSEEIETYLADFVSDPMIQCHYVNLSSEIAETVDKVLLLYILFIKTNKQSFRAKEYQHILKEIIYYTNAYKTHHYLSGAEEYAYSIERYFMRLELHQLTVKRVNLKYFNFKESKISGDCQFYQCKFYHTNLQNVLMDDAKFYLCEFTDVDQFTMQEKENHANDFLATFDCCSITRTQITSQAIIFRNCKIDNFQLQLIGER